MLIGNADLGTGRRHLSEALALGEQAVRVTERRDPVCLETLAQLYVKAGDPGRARRIVDEALHLPDLPSGVRKRLSQQFSRLEKPAD